MLRGVVAAAALAAALGLGALWLTRPVQDDPGPVAGLAGDPARGETVFWAGGCASCHAAPGAEGAARLVLSGGLALGSPFGTFSVPNISPDPDHGIGGWSATDLWNAMHHGTSPEGRHYYPAFPYTSYVHATPQEVADLHAFLATLPLSDRADTPHALGFPFDQRALLGVWKALNPAPGWVVAGPLSPEEERGRALVEGLGHCGECHTPRNALGIRDLARWLGGGPNPEGRGTIPNITPAHLDWSPNEVAAYLETGFTPDFDSAGGQMAEVVENMARLPAADRAAIAAYLARVPPVP
jgi:mono/diheme cytochrome c family protein